MRKAIAVPPSKKHPNGTTKYVKLSAKEIKAREEEETSWKHKQEKYIKEEKYRDDRRVEYPEIGDQLDAIWKHLNYQKLNGNELIQEADDILGKILAVKKKHPKPETKK